MGRWCRVGEGELRKRELQSKNPPDLEGAGDNAAERFRQLAAAPEPIIRPGAGAAEIIAIARASTDEAGTAKTARDERDITCSVTPTRLPVKLHVFLRLF